MLRDSVQREDGANLSIAPLQTAVPGQRRVQFVEPMGHPIPSPCDLHRLLVEVDAHERESSGEEFVLHCGIEVREEAAGDRVLRVADKSQSVSLINL